MHLSSIVLLLSCAVYAIGSETHNSGPDYLPTTEPSDDSSYDETSEHHNEDEDDTEESDYSDHVVPETQHHGEHSHPWKYHGELGPSHWGDKHVKCAPTQSRQSPIDILPDHSILNENLHEISLLVDATHNNNVTIRNSGHSVNLVFSSTTRVVGGSLGGAFQLAGVHFHWGHTDHDGSEHTVKGRHFPLEMHVVTFDESRFDSVSDAVNGENGLAVFGVLFQIDKKHNAAFDSITASLSQITTAGSEVTVPHISLRSLLPNNMRYYFRYLGSLTTPPCAETVIWTVFENSQYISSEQMQQFRQLYEHDDDDSSKILQYNWRPTQPLRGRTVFRNFDLPARPRLHVDVVESSSAETEQDSGSVLVHYSVPLLVTTALITIISRRTT